MSTQAKIMSEEVCFNYEPGFEKEAGTPESEKLNEGYSNIVHYGNVNFTMLSQLKNLVKGFKTSFKTYFYLKKDILLKIC